MRKRDRLQFRFDAALKARGLSLRALAAALRMDLTGLRRLRRGGRWPTWRTAIAIAEALGVTLDSLAGRSVG